MRKASEMQLKAISHVTGPAKVIAGPGSGKTFTIVQRIIHLIVDHQVNPDKILTITFTKAAAIEMQERYQKETEGNPLLHHIKEPVHFGTFHGICYTILKESGLISKFTLIKETEKRKLMEIVLKNQGIMDACDYDTISQSLDAVSRRKNFCETDSFLPGLSKETGNKIYLEYDSMMKQQRFLDFDDMILVCLQNLQENHRLRKKWQERFSYLLVDEFQDINEIQYHVVKILAGSHGNLFVVGDDDQSIYGFRGSAPGIMRKFSEDFQSVRELFLSENYRSGNEIVEFANRVINRNKDRIKKSPVPVRKGGKVYVKLLETRQEEERRLLTDMKKYTGKHLDDCAVIVRTNAEAYRYADFLKQNGITVKGRRLKEKNPFQSLVADDYIAFLKFCYEGHKRSDFLKIMNKPNLFLSGHALTEETVTKEGIFAFYKNNREMIRTLDMLFRNYQIAGDLSPFLSLQYFRKVMGYDEYLKQKSSSENRAEILQTADCLQELFRKMKKGEGTEEFWKEIQEKQAKVKQEWEATGGVSVITMHGAKGLEFDCVFLPDLNEGVIPGKNVKANEEIEEERRLLYVAITRAQNSLYLYYTKERNRKLTRFLEGLV